MIDTCKFHFKMTDRVRSRLCSARSGNYPDIKIYRTCFYLKPMFATGSVPVYFNHHKMELSLETSLPKFLQGHNVFGSNRLELMCLEVIKIIYAYLGLKYTYNDERLIRKARIRLSRLDITCSFRLASAEMVSQVLELLYEHFRAEGKGWSIYGSEEIECIYSRQSSTRVTDKFYNKGKEVLVPKHRIPADVFERDRIERMASVLVRFEHTIRGKELTGKSLNFAHCWDAELVKAKLASRLKKFKLQGVIHPKLDAEALIGLNNSCRTFYQLWAEGGNQALICLVALPIPGSSAQAAKKLPEHDIDYIPAEKLKLSWWARWLFDKNQVAEGWRKWMLVWPNLLWFGIVGLLSVFLLWAMSQSTAPLSTRDTIILIYIGLLAWYARYLVDRFCRLVDDRIVLASDHMVGFKEFGVCLELFKPEGSNADMPKRARMIKYAGTCPICAAQVLLDKGEPDFPRRIVGRCQESPREHVFSFDRATRTGYRLR